MMLKLYNTLTRKKENFKPLKKGYVGAYTCGPTVYNFAHLGNLRSYVFADLLKRVLKYNKFKVNHIINITDVGHLASDADAGEDKMMKAIKREGLKPTLASMLKLAEKYTKSFKNDLKQLNIQEPDKWVKATEHIKEMVDLVKILVKKGYAYETSTAIYFNISKYKDYGKLAKLSLEQLEVGARVEPDPEKKNPLDFALWFKTVGKHEKHLMQWESPWGKGFPGWHIECSAMSSKYLGKQFDIHTGGIDHVPVHHTNEIAQSEAAFGKKPWVKYWLHNDFLVLAGEKMAKSSGNFLTLQSLVDKGYDPLAYRYFLLSAVYRKQLMFSEQAMKDAQHSLERLRNIVLEIISDKTSNGNVKKYKENFLQEIDNDLNTPRAMAVLWEVLRDKNLGGKEKYELVLDFDQVFGLGLDKVKKTVVKIDQELKDLIEKREKARKEKDFALADKIRDQIKKNGFVLKDMPNGVVWEKI
ncbi:MAG: cysteine--tRNA ligase [archaeon]